MTMTIEKLAELKRLAEKATPGRWEIDHRKPGGSIVSIGPIMAEEYAGSAWLDVSEKDAAFIAAANPQTILSLIALAERALNTNSAALSEANAERALEPQGQALPELPQPPEGKSFVEWALPESDYVPDFGLAMHADDVKQYGRECYDAGRASQIALPAGLVAAPVDGVHWDQFPAYLIDKCEGATIYEESLQQWLADMLKDPDYIRIAAERASPLPAVAQPVPAGPVPGAAISEDAERKDFEVWAAEPIRAKKLPLARHANGAYSEGVTYQVWYGWISRARNSPAVAQPVEIDPHAVELAEKYAFPGALYPKRAVAHTVADEREVIAKLITEISDNWPMRKLSLEEICAKLLARAALGQPAEEGGKS